MSNKLERNSFSGKENLPPGRAIDLEALAVSVKPKFAKANKAIPREVAHSNFRIKKASPTIWPDSLDWMTNCCD